MGYADGLQAFTRGADSRVLLLLLIVFIDILSVGLVIPLIPFYAVDLGADAQMIGLLGSFYGVLQLVGSALVGKISDLWGRRTVFGLSIIGAITSYWWMTQVTSIPMLFVSRVPVGVLKQTMLASNTCISDLTNHTDRAKYLGYVSTAASMGYIIGPAIGGVCSEMFGKAVPVYVACALFGVDLLLVLFCMTETSQVAMPEPEESRPLDLTSKPGLLPTKPTQIQLCDFRQAFRTLTDSSTLLYLFLIQFFSSLAQLTFYSSFSQFAFMQYQLDSSSNGYLTAYQSVLEVVVQSLLIAPFTHRFQEIDLLRASLLVLSLSVMGLGVIHHFHWVLAILIPTIFSLGMQSTCMTSVITKVSSSSSVGTVLGVASSLTSICRALTPYVGGLIMETYGMLGGMTLVSLLCIGVTVGLHWYPASPHAVEIAPLSSLQKEEDGNGDGEEEEEEDDLPGMGGDLADQRKTKTTIISPSTYEEQV